MKRVGGAVVLIVATTLVLTSCGTKVPAPTATPTPSTSLTPAPKHFAQIFYVGDTPTGFKLFSENYPVADSGIPALAKLIGDLLNGTAKPRDPDYFNLWGNGSLLNSIKIVGSLVTVDLHIGKLNVGSEAEMRAIDEIFWSIAKFIPKITRMVLLVDGKKVESLAGHVDATKTFILEPTYDVLNAVQITSLHEGEKVVSPLTVSGEACTFEANVAWELSKSGAMVKSGAVTAKEDCPTRSKWTLNLGILSPGTYQLRAKDFSAKDGSLVAQDSKNFEVIRK